MITLLANMLETSVLAASTLPGWWFVGNLTDGTPSENGILRLLLLQDFNTRVVLLGTTLLGLASGIIGSFTLLRKRALMGDALSHATLPGIALAFMLVTLFGGDGKELGWLLAGGTATGVLGVLAVLGIRHATRIKEDAAMGIVLSVFFGAGVAILGVAQQMETGHAAGLESFIYGKAASMNLLDAQLIAIVSVAAVVVSLLMFKELKLLCFDQNFAALQGFPVPLLDSVLMALTVAVTIIGLQAVGLILMIALLVIPPAAARFWTQELTRMTVISALIGSLSALIGAGWSALTPDAPSGALIVIVATIAFLISMLFGPARGLVARTARKWELEQKIRQQHLLRACYEWLEDQSVAPESDAHESTAPVRIAELVPMRSWNHGELRKSIRQAERDGLVIPGADETLRLTKRGARQAAHTVHDHRLWEMYLITHADIAPSQVDRDADAIEHILDAEMIAELETLLAKHERRDVPVSPHPLAISTPPETGPATDPN